MLEDKFLVFLFQGVHLLELVLEGIELLYMHLVLILGLHHIGFMGLFFRL